MVELTLRSDYAQYLNFKKHTNFKQDDFRNSDHLNLTGAKKLTRLLNR